MILSFTAIEAFANHLIPDDHRFSVDRQDGQCTCVYTKPQIERFVKLDTKLAEVLPEVRSVKSPKGTKVWQGFIWLKNLRDRLVHLKSSDLKQRQDKNLEDYAWAMLLDPKVLRSAQVAKDVMAWYFPEDPPRWLQKCPI